MWSNNHTCTLQCLCPWVLVRWPPSDIARDASNASIYIKTLSTLKCSSTSTAMLLCNDVMCPHHVTHESPESFCRPSAAATMLQQALLSGQTLRLRSGGADGPTLHRAHCQIHHWLVALPPDSLVHVVLVPLLLRRLQQQAAGRGCRWTCSICTQSKWALKVYFVARPPGRALP